MTYKFSIYDFTDKEINQIVELAEQWLAGGLWNTIDKRKYTKQVIQYALNWNLLVKGENVHESYKNDLKWKKFQDKRIYNNSDILNNFLPAYDLPVEALWRLFEKHILSDAKGEHGIYGYSLSTVKGWINLNIRYNGHKNQEKYDWEQLEIVISQLVKYNYLTWQTAGSIWRIEIHKNLAYPGK